MKADTPQHRRFQARAAQRKRKVRTPDHVRADMSFHYVAFLVVKCGFSIEAVQSDYGYDAYVQFYESEGEVETGNVFVQLKATENVRRLMTPRGIAYSIDMRDFDLWADNPYPVYFVLFDAGAETAYWMYFQKYVQERGLASDNMSVDSLTVHLDPACRFDAATPLSWRSDKNKALAQLAKVKHADF